MKPSHHPNPARTACSCSILLTLAVFSSTASQYSITFPPGFSTLANHVAAADIQTLLGPPFPQVLEMQAVFPLTPYAAGDLFLNDGGMWITQDANPAVYNIPNGKGMFIFNPTVSPIPAIVSGPANPGVVQLSPNAPGWYLGGRQNIGRSTFESTVGRSPRDYAFVHAYRFNGLTQNYDEVSQFADSPNAVNRHWSPSAPIAPVGEALWFRLGPSTGPANPNYFAPNANFTISGVTPSSANANVSFNLEVTGSGFDGTEEVRLSPMAGGPSSGWNPATADADGFILTSSVNLNNPPLQKGYYRVDVRRPPNGQIQTMNNVFYLKVPNNNLTVSLSGPTMVLGGVQTPLYTFVVANPGGNVANVNLSVVIPGSPTDPLVNIVSQVGGAGFVAAPPGIASSTFTLPANSSVSCTFKLTPSVGLITIPATTLQLVGQITSPNSQQAQSIRLVEVVASLDPNDKIGPIGVGTPRYITGLDPAEYLVRFENKPDATAPAHQVVVTDQLDTTKLNLATFELGAVTFGPKTVTPPAGLQTWTTDVAYDVDGNPSTLDDNILVRIEAALDALLSSSTYGQVTWKFSSLEATPPYLPVLLPNVGFLPANVTAPQGEGSVSFKITPFSNLGSGQTIANEASIVFDVNAPILTGQWINTIDLDAPTSSVDPLPASQPAASFPVSWSGTDADSGLAHYDVYVSDNGGPLVKWQDASTATSAVYTGQFDHTYRFHSIAVDQVGNYEDVPETPDAETTVKSECGPESLTIERVGDTLSLTWTNPGYRLQATSDFNTWDDLPTATSPAVLPTDSPHRFFRLICR
jgi:hypothetical protein